MIINEKQIMRLMDFVNDYALLLAMSKDKNHAAMFNNMRGLLDEITAQQSEKLKEIK